jgi:plastocyanin domain-containing protein
MTIRTTFLSLILATLVGGTAAVAKPAPPAPAPAPTAAAAKRVEIAVTRKGFTPDHIAVKKDQPVILSFTRKTDATCAKTVVVELGDGNKVQKDLPLDKTVEVAATFTKAGELSYACGMDMVHGVLTVQ